MPWMALWSVEATGPARQGGVLLEDVYVATHPCTGGWTLGS